MDEHNWRERVFDVAAGRIGVALTSHGPRHTAASLAIQAGADVTVVKRMLGHSPEVCLKIYAHLFDGSLDSVVARMDAARSGGADVIPLRAPKAPHITHST